jgi:hypothetical protein
MNRILDLWKATAPEPPFWALAARARRTTHRVTNANRPCRARQLSMPPCNYFARDALKVR